ncbi:MAG: hypothetical protein IJT98_09660 [Prevotella sp.]|nr:hypothetical protein [Prevotella sp.]
MKKWLFLSLMFGVVSLQAVAQDDDMYFVPSRQNGSAQNSGQQGAGLSGYSGSQRSVDEYNRRGSYYEVLPTDTGDVITFSGVVGVYPSDSVGDYTITQRMQRWDGYTPSDAYWEGYTQGRNDSWGWRSPWYYSYYPWYDSWYYDSWYYDPWYWRHGGWYDPWYSWGWGGYYSSWYYRPWHYYGGWYGGGGGVRHHYAYGNGSGTGTIDRYGRTGGSLSGYRGSANSSRFNRASGRTVTGHTNYGTGTRTRVNTSGSGNFSGSRSSGSSYGSGASGGGSSFGGSRSSGNSGGSFSSGGGSRSSGGSFGGGGGSRGGGGGGGGRSGGSRR